MLRGLAEGDVEVSVARAEADALGTDLPHATLLPVQDWYGKRRVLTSALGGMGGVAVLAGGADLPNWTPLLLQIEAFEVFTTIRRTHRLALHTLALRRVSVL